MPLIIDEKEIEDYLFNFLKESNFITFKFNALNRYNSNYEIKTKEYSKDKTNSKQIINSIICFEKTCLIIESIDIKVISKVLKKTNSKLINTSSPSFNTQQSKEYQTVIEEINNFRHSQPEIKNNDFIQYTINPILTFIVRRYFCPSSYFKDPSFFIFDNRQGSLETNLRKKMQFKEYDENEHKKIDLKTIINCVDSINNTINKSNNFFTEEEFIVLRTMSKSSSIFQIVIHKASLYIFILKKSNDCDHFQREIDFNQSYSHRCLTPSYGFLIENGKITGILYEYMTNDNLENYFKENDSKITEIYSFLAMNRILQGIDYLHSNHMIHRDLKPSNILINHDNLPFIADFEMIRSVDGDESSFNAENFTYSFGTIIYSSPEQDEGEYVSYSTDIYSFGLLVYFLFEKKKWTNSVYDSKIAQMKKTEDFPAMTKGTKDIQDLYRFCIKYDQKERAKLSQIKNILYDEAKSFLFFDSNFIEEINQNNLKVLIQYFYENFFNILECYNRQALDEQTIQWYISFFLSYINDISNESQFLILFGNLYKIILKNLVKAKIFYNLATKANNSDAFLQIGDLYFDGFDTKYFQNYEKAIENYKLAANLNNCEALLKLGNIYLNGIDNVVEPDCAKAKKYFEQAAEQDSAEAYYNLGLLYYTGNGVEIDFFQAKEFFEIAAQQNYSKAFIHLGTLYFNGQGVEQNISKAKENYEIAIKLNNPDAYVNLGNLYFVNPSIPQNFLIAKMYYETAAKFNVPDGFLNLGNIYLNGNGVIPNFLIAKNYFEEAAKLKNAKALIQLGNLYLNGIGVVQDYSIAKHYFELAEELQNPESFIILGNLYFEGTIVKQDMNKARKYYEKAVKHDRSAFLNLGNCYLNGYGGDIDYKKAKECYEIASNDNNPIALLFLGDMYINGFGCEKDFDKGNDCYVRSSKFGCDEALNKIGLIYENGFGTEKDYSKARKWYELSASKNNSNAYNYLGALYLKGLGVDKNYSKAKEFFEFATRLNNSEAFCWLGIIYSEGFGVMKNLQKSREMFEIAAKLKNPNAFLSLGFFYSNGIGVDQDYKKAKEYFEEATKLNCSQAYIEIANLYFNGYGVEKNYLKAKEYFEIAAKLNNSMAFINLGYLYLNGNGVKQDYKKAKEYFEIAGKQNNPVYYLYLGFYYSEFFNPDKDLFLAKMYFEKAAKQNNPIAIYKLGHMYFFGNGVEKDYKKAREYFEKSAELNCTFSMIQLGVIYFSGYDVEKDVKEAKKYFEKASILQNPLAFIFLGMYHRFSKERECLKAKDYFELAAKRGLSDGYFFLGELFSDGFSIEVDNEKAIKYFSQCLEKKDEMIILYNPLDKCHDFRPVINQYRYHAGNSLGLIYLLASNDIDKATHYIKESAFSEYPFAQNNLGLLYQFFNNNNKTDSQYMYERSSKHSFALAEYNLGYMKEKDEKIDEAIEFYVKASDHEEEPLIFHNIQYIDIRLEVSKVFILRFVNLKLCVYYLSKSNLDESKKFFIKSLSKLEEESDLPDNLTYHFEFRFPKNVKKNPFSYIKDFILQYPPFNLNNQPNLDTKLKQKLQKELNDNDFKKADLDIQKEKRKSNEINSSLKKSNGKFINSDQVIAGMQIDNENIIDVEDQTRINDPANVFDFAVKNKLNKQEFIDEINEIVDIMRTILYTPPYPVLFGRLSIEKKKKERTQDNSKSSIPNINQTFHEAFNNE